MTKQIFLAVISTLCSIHVWATDAQWESLATGLDYMRIPCPSISTHGRIHAFRISLTNYNLDILIAKDYGKSSLSATKFAHKAGSLITINGGFFSPDYQPLGLRIQQGVIRSPLKDTSWWGVFYIKDHHPHIVSQRQYPATLHPEFAIQAGPRLIVNGSIPTLKEGYAERSALCITKTHEIVIAITEQAPLTTAQFARILQRPSHQNGIGCYQALNLDGGSSSQLFAELPGFTLNVMGFHDVTDAIIVKAKQQMTKESLD